MVEILSDTSMKDQSIDVKIIYVVQEARHTDIDRGHESPECPIAAALTFPRRKRHPEHDWQRRRICRHLCSSRCICHYQAYRHSTARNIRTSEPEVRNESKTGKAIMKEMQCTCPLFVCILLKIGGDWSTVVWVREASAVLLPDIDDKVGAGLDGAHISR